jgi:hypothetical protein
MPAVWNRHERCGAHRANFARTGTNSLRMPQVRVCDERAVGADDVQGQPPVEIKAKRVEQCSLRRDRRFAFEADATEL